MWQMAVRININTRDLVSRLVHLSVCPLSDLVADGGTATVLEISFERGDVTVREYQQAEQDEDDRPVRS